MNRICYSDTETFSAVPINAGTYRYAANAEVMLWPYAFDDGPVSLWDRTSGAKMPADLADALADPECIFMFHNAMFDRNVIRLGDLKITIPIQRVRCTMARALAHSLPGALGKLCEVFKIPDELSKIKEGKDLVQLFCKPRPKKQKIRRATRHTHPEKWAQFCDYANGDVLAMRALDKVMPNWNYQGAELELWFLDQIINDRGMCVDIEFAEGAIRAVDREQKRLAEAVQEHTNGAVQSATQRDVLLEHILTEYGVDLPDMTASTIERRANDPDLPIELRELLMLRLDATTASTAKYRRFVGSANDDGRVRGTAQFCGAARTGRWAHRTVQPGNMPRPSRDFDEVMQFIEAVKADCADLV